MLNKARVQHHGVGKIREQHLVEAGVVANRPGGYDEALVGAIEPFLASCANLIVAYRLDQRREEAEQALHRTERRLRLAVVPVLLPIHSRTG